VVKKNVPIPMRDGLALNADLYFPARNGAVLEGRHGTLLQRSPYNKEGNGNVRLGQRYAGMGYVVVLQDERGRFSSPGREFKYGEQAEDGYDTVEWIAQQPWSNGKIGTFGASTPGQNQNALATLNPPHLAAMVVAVAGSDYSLVGVRQQGAYHLRFFAHQFTGQIRQNRISEENPVYLKAVEDSRQNFEEWLWRLPLRPGLSPFKYFPENESWFFSTYTTSDYPGEDGFWKKRGFNIPLYYGEHADVATIYIGSWYDTYAQAQTENFAAIAKLKKKTPKRLFFHPLGHTEWLTRTHAGDVDFGEAVRRDFDDFRMRWYEKFVKGVENDIVESTAPVTLFVMGGGDGRKNEEGRMNHGGYWREEREWPLPQAVPTKYYFHPDGALKTSPPTQAAASTTYQYDPDNPVPSVGSNQSGFNPYLPAGPYDQVCDPERFIGCRDRLPLETRHDIVVFKSEPLRETVELIGPIEVTLWASSDAPDTDFTAKLIDEYPPNLDYPYGFQLYLNKGIVRARYRDSREKQELMKPGEIYPFTIKVYPTANRFMPGHRIVVHLSSSDFPEFDRNPNTGEPLGKNRMKRIAVNTIYHDAERPSHITLSLVPAASN
jgi:putative CocE/NonD family hydrolase